MVDAEGGKQLFEAWPHGQRGPAANVILGECFHGAIFDTSLAE